MRNPMTLGVLVVLLLVVAGCNPFLDRRGASSPHSRSPTSWHGDGATKEVISGRSERTIASIEE
jgi:hypothetical protein